jgi:ribonuclease-3
VQNLARNTKLSEIAQQTGITAHVAKIRARRGEVSHDTGVTTVEAVVRAVY